MFVSGMGALPALRLPAPINLRTVRRRPSTGGWEHAMKRIVITLAAALFAGHADAAEYLEKTEMQKSRAFSPAVITEGGRTVYMAGQTTLADENGNNIAGNFEAQARRILKLMDKTLQRGGGSLKKLVTMTVFITALRHADRFVED